MAAELNPPRMRDLIRNASGPNPPAGIQGYIQANLVMMPQEQAFNFLLFCVRILNHGPLLDVWSRQGSSRHRAGCGPAHGPPRYRIYENGRLQNRGEDVSALYPQRMVSFLLGCSFSFENAMLAAAFHPQHRGGQKRLHVRHQRDCRPPGRSPRKLVVTMRE